MNKFISALLAGLLSIGSISVFATEVLPEGWFKAGSSPQSYKMGVDELTTFDGGKSAFIQSTLDNSSGFGTLMQVSGAEEYLGKRVKFSFYIKSQDVNEWAGGWFRVDGAGGKVVAFDNMGERPIKGTTDWTPYSIVLDVPDDAKNMSYGVLFAGGGKGKVWFDNLSFKVVDKNTPLTGKEGSLGKKKAKNLSFESE